MDSLWWEYQLDPRARNRIESLLTTLAARYLKQGIYQDSILLVPATKRTSGSYRLGDVIYADEVVAPFGLNETDWIQHVAILGRTGSGKTNVGFLILRELTKAGKPWMVVDWKRNYRDLLQLPEFVGVRVYTVGRPTAPFAFNPLEPPPGTPHTVWLKKVVEVASHTFSMKDAAAYLLYKACDAVYRNAGVYDGQSKAPTLLDVKAWLDGYRGKGSEAQWQRTANKVISSLCFGETGRVLTTESNEPLVRMLDQRVILEVDALVDMDKIFLGALVNRCVNELQAATRFG